MKNKLTILLILIASISFGQKSKHKQPVVILKKEFNTYQWLNNGKVFREIGIHDYPTTIIIRSDSMIFEDIKGRAAEIDAGFQVQMDGYVERYCHVGYQVILNKIYPDSIIRVYSNSLTAKFFNQ